MPDDARMYGLRRIANVALTVAAAAVTVIAVGVVVGLFLWVYSLPDQDAAPPNRKVASGAAMPLQEHDEPPARAPAAPHHVAAHAAPNPPPAVPAVPNAPAPPPVANAPAAPAAANVPALPAAANAAGAPISPNAAQRNAAQRSAAVAAAQAAAASNGAQVAPPGPHENSDAERNRAFGQALSHLGNDPEMQRRLAAPH